MTVKVVFNTAKKQAADINVMSWFILTGSDSMPDAKRVLLKEDKWSKTFELRPGVQVFESKFETEGLSVSITDLQRTWNAWDESERNSFVRALRHKPRFTAEDEKVLEFLMEHGNEVVWSNLALSLLHHSNRKLVLEFLIQRLKAKFKPKTNFYQALALLGDPSAITILLHEYRENQEAIASGTPDRYDILEFLACSAALNSLGANGDYSAEIGKYLNHPDEVIRRSAERKLAGPESSEVES